jgi:hypothetical protein
MDERTPDAVAQRAADDVRRVLNTPGLRRIVTLAKRSQETPVGPNPPAPPVDGLPDQPDPVP